MEGNLSLSALNPIFYPKYWLGLTTSTWPIFAWTDGRTPGPDVFSTASTLYRHWGSYMWVALLPAGNSLQARHWRNLMWQTAAAGPHCWRAAAPQERERRAQQPGRMRGGGLPRAILHQRHGHGAVRHPQRIQGLGLERPELLGAAALRVHGAAG